MLNDTDLGVLPSTLDFTALNGNINVLTAGGCIPPPRQFEPAGCRFDQLRAAKLRSWMVFQPAIRTDALA
jgi:hypothetical protein